MCVLALVLTALVQASLPVVHDRLHIVTREESSSAIHHTLIPTVVILLDNVDDCTFLE